MSDERRSVRVSHAVFDELDRVLGIERGPNGEPSVNDFLTIDLLPIVDAFATRFDELPEVVRGRPDYRRLISAGVLGCGHRARSPPTDRSSCSTSASTSTPNGTSTSRPAGRQQ